MLLFCLFISMSSPFMFVFGMIVGLDTREQMIFQVMSLTHRARVRASYGDDFNKLISIVCTFL